MERSPHDGGQNAALCGTAATHYALYMIGPQNQIETCIQKCIWPIFCDNWFIAAAIFSVTIGRQFLNMLPSPCIYRCIGGRFPISRLKCYPASVITLLPRQRTLLNVNDEYIGLSGGFQKLPASWNNFNDAVCSPPRLCKFSFWGTKIILHVYHQQRSMFWVNNFCEISIFRIIISVTFFRLLHIHDKHSSLLKIRSHTGEHAVEIRRYHYLQKRPKTQAADR